MYFFPDNNKGGRAEGRTLDLQNFSLCLRSFPSWLRWEWWYRRSLRCLLVLIYHVSVLNCVVVLSQRLVYIMFILEIIPVHELDIYVETCSPAAWSGYTYFKVQGWIVVGKLCTTSVSYCKFLECCWKQRYCIPWGWNKWTKPEFVSGEWWSAISENCGEWLEDDVFFHFVKGIELYWNSTVLYSSVFCCSLKWSLLLLQELLWQSWLPSTKCCWLWKDHEECLSKHEGTSSGHERQI